MNADWKVQQAEHAEFNVPTCGKIAVCQPCRERQPFLNSHDGLNLTCFDQCHGVGSHGTSSSQGWRQRIVYKVYSLNLIDEFRSLFLPKVIVAGLPRKAFPRMEAGLCRHQCRCASNSQDSPQASPRVIFKRKNLIEQLKPLLIWMLIERGRAQHAEFNVPTCGKIAVWQPCRERQPFWNSHDGLNLTCLDQCHGVGSHGTSSSQGWRQRIVIKSTV